MMSESHHTMASDDDEGASTRPRISLRAWVWSVAGVAALTAIAAWFGLSQASQPVRWQTVGFSVDSPTETEITFDVFLYTDQPVTCHVRALSVNFAEVGVADVAIDPAKGETQRITEPISTVEEATSVDVNYCDIVR